MSDTMTNTRTPRHILELTCEEKLKFINSFDCIFSDIDGVVHILDTDFEGAPEGFNELTNVGKKLKFITNNSIRKVDDCVNRFKSLNIDVKAEDIIHPAASIVQYLQSIKFEGLLYVIATELFKNYLKEAGFKYVDGPNEILRESFHTLAHHAFDKQPVRAVIIDVDFNLSSTKLIRAQVYLRHPDCILIAGATDKFLPVEKNFSIIGPGAFTKLLADASKKEVIVLGKPGAALAKMLHQRFNIQNTKRVLMIGDMLEQDIGFGSECGFQTLAVLTGGCKLEELFSETNAKYIPNYYADSVADFVKFMQEVNKSNL